METTVFNSGNSQAVRIPKAFRIEGDRVMIERQGSRIILSPLETDNKWPEGYIESLADAENAADETFLRQPQGEDRAQAAFD